ncbi:MAG: hypothetical protein JWO30_3693 [Fibrobacteres bacterium]|nr:hypothetical protein [Fibrobacterota bacterium]
MNARALSVLAALLCTFCTRKDQVAGGYDDVENPAIQVSLLDDQQKPYGAGELRIYARYQIPSKDSLPIIDQHVSAGTAVTIRDSALVSAMVRAQTLGTPWPNQDTVEFNVNTVAPDGEAFLGNFLMARKPGGAFSMMRRTGGTLVHADTKGVLAVSPIMAGPVLHQRGNIGAHGLELGLQSVFVPGSPYWAQVQSDGSFVLARMAVGSYEVKAVSADAKVYSAADSLTAGTEYLPSDWSEADLIWVE